MITGCNNESLTQESEEMQMVDSHISIVGNEENRRVIIYDVTISNPDGIRIVDVMDSSVDVIFAKVLKDRIEEIKSSSLEYNESGIKISGEISVTWMGITQEELSHFEPIIKAVQFIGDDNKEYLILQNSS